MSPLQAPIIEIFSSLQGEGPYVGERQTFVRFQDCDLSCRFCDTPLSFVENKACRVESPPLSRKFRRVPNPISVGDLAGALRDFDDRTLSVTGGEPLQKVAFLKAWLPSARRRFRILLETAGVHAGEFHEIADLVDIISMDIKLPTSTGMRPWWKEHEAFLKAAQGKDIYIKAVVTAETSEEDVRRAMEIVAAADSSIPFILQPATPFAQFRAAPSQDQLADWQTIISSRIPHVRVIPQMHKHMGLL